ncbi:MAG TPA: helix-turn-helix domain-containing protein, partial [Micromonosporaceae bacterium]
MRVTDGSVSAHFQHLRLPMGTGLGGLVAQTGTPYVTDRYQDDPRFQHTTEIDAGVAEEGIVSILGVPMRLGGRSVGVLFAANRTPKPFGRQDVTLLSSFADHAAVAIDNARLLAETRTALAELSAANKVSREHSEALERAAAAHDRMAELVLRGSDVADLAATVADLLGGALAVLDVDGRWLASVGELGPESGVGEAASAARALGRTVQRGEWWATAVNAAGDSVCALVLRTGRAMAEADLRVFERAAVVTALLLLSQRSAAEAESRVRGELLDDLLSRPVDDPDAMWRRARRMGVDLEQPYSVVVLHGPADLRQRIAAWAANQAARGSGLAAYRDGFGVLLMPSEDPSQLAARTARELGPGLSAAVTVGAAGPVRSPAEVAEAFHTAQRCATALVALGLTGGSASPADLGFAGLLLGGGPAGIDQYVRSYLGPVLDYDARRGTALIATLAAYFDVGGSPARAAESLHVHVNTVAQRLERLATLLGEDWQRPDRSLEIQLALRLHRLLAIRPA